MNLEAPILITGGTGFVGSHLLEKLISLGYHNIHVTSFNGVPPEIAAIIPANHVHMIDLKNHEQVNLLIKELKPEHIYHLAAFAAVGSSFDQCKMVLENNSEIQLALLEAVRDHAHEARILVIGSAMEYDLIGNTQRVISETHPLGPVSPYAVSKVIQDLLALSFFYSYRLQIVRARPFNHIGERQTTDFAIPHFAQQIVAIERGQQTEIHVGNLDAVRDFTDVKDVVEAYVLLMEKGTTGDVYNIGSGRGYTMQQMLDTMCHLAKTPVKVITDPNKVRPLDVPAIIADSSKIRKLGWQPKISIEETVQRILNEWRAK